MPAPLFMAYNGPAPTTAAQVPVTTGTVIKTLLQIATPATAGMRPVEWGISFDASAAATPIRCELVDTNVAATVTAFVPADIIKVNVPTGPNSLMTLGTAASGYTASAEGAITGARELDVQFVAPTGGYLKQFPLSREIEVPVSRFLRVRVTAVAAVNAYCYVLWEE